LDLEAMLFLGGRINIEVFGASPGFLTGLARTEPVDLLLPAGFIVGGLLLGLIFEKIVLGRIKSFIAGTRWGGDDVISGSVRGVTALWFGIAGVHLAIIKLPLDRAVADFLRDLLLVALIFSGAIVVARIAAGLVRLYVNRVEGLPSSLLTNLVRITVLTIGALVVLQSLGIRVAPIIAALGIGGLAVALALQDTFANLFSGIMITVSRQLRPGDFVRLDSGEEGYVEDVTWRNTTIRALANNMIIVPNSKLGASTIINYYQPEQQMSVIVPVGVSYDSDLSHVEEVTIEVAGEVMSEIEGGVPEFDPMIRFNNFSDFSIDFSVIMRTREVVAQYAIKHEFIKRLHRRYGEEGIVIPYPITTIQTSGDGSSSAPQRRAFGGG
jgi:small-conductance mechanosensitive channel